jgi:hypothetical protein
VDVVSKLSRQQKRLQITGDATLLATIYAGSAWFLSHTDNPGFEQSRPAEISSYLDQLIRIVLTATQRPFLQQCSNQTDH